MQKTTVGIIYGGRSVEHEVSIISALQAAHALDQDKYQAVLVYISKQGQWYVGQELWDLDNYRNLTALLEKCRKVTFSPNYNQFKLLYEFQGGLFKKPEEELLDIAFPVIHGTHGEDGCLQGLLELSGIPYIGAGVLGSACGMDKIAMKAVLKEAGLPVPDYTWFYASAWEDDKEAVVKEIEGRLSYPVIVKPASLGSSIGITKAANLNQLEEAIELAASFAPRILAEQVIQPLREINISVLGSVEEMEVSCAEEPLSADDILSFRDKYLSGGKGMGGSKRRIPADIPEEVLAVIEDYAKRAFKALDLSGVCRIDFLLQPEEGTVYVNEVNTIPGSLSFYLWGPAGKSFSRLLDDLIRIALRRKRLKDKMIFSHKSNILSIGGLKGGKK